MDAYQSSENKKFAVYALNNRKIIIINAILLIQNKGSDEMPRLFSYNKVNFKPYQ
jgi:hypothetical protein